MSCEAPPSAVVFDLKHNSAEDGPGIRSVVFLKGCSLDCVWCHNPEGKASRPELLYDPSTCIACGLCTAACPTAALSSATEAASDPPALDRDLCNRCLQCVEACPSTSLRQVGYAATVEDLVEAVLPYRTFMEVSGGGVTISGGEATLRMRFLGLLLRRLKAEGFHTLLETSGRFELAAFESEVLPHLDLIYMDIKLIDDERHRRLCGVGNARILHNFVALHRLSERSHFSIVPRTPLVPGCNDSEEDLERLGRFYRRNGVDRAALLENNPAWFTKAEGLGLPVMPRNDEAVRSLYDPGRLETLWRILGAHGVESAA